MDVFGLREALVRDYARYARSFIQIQEQRLHEYVEQCLNQGVFWPEALIQLNPNFQPGAWIDDLVQDNILHPECRFIFRKGKAEGEERPMRLYQHQLDAILTAREGHNYVLTTGTGSGKSLAYIVPIVDSVLRHGSGNGVKAIVVYPMNALANSQYYELEKFLRHGYPSGGEPVTFARYTGQESDEIRNRIIAHPPDIILTNYVMLELLLTRPREHQLIQSAQGLQFLVLDELHTYRGRQGADVALLVRRVRDRMAADHMQCVGTSATLASEGSFDEQRAEVARVATQIFGAEVRPEHVIGETLQRATSEYADTDPAFVDALRTRLKEDDLTPPHTYDDFVANPLSSWIESVFGVSRDHTSRLVRSEPISIRGERGAAYRLSQVTGVDETRCAEIIEHWLLAGYACDPHPDTGFSPFAFRLHQFISPGDTVYASLEDEDTRYITVHGQRFVPGDRARVLFPLVFCRECGQEYYSVRMTVDDETGQYVFEPREFSDRLSDDEGTAGYIYLNTAQPWPTEPDDIVEHVPEDWLEDYRGQPRVHRNRRDWLPQHVAVAPSGEKDTAGQECVFIETPFRFCLCCGVSYSSRQASDFGKLASLSSEGRSSATTILSLSSILTLRDEEMLPQHARKLLSFTDNRQDASLQAGHFNDFVEVGLLRAALYKAVRHVGSDGLTHETLTERVFDALDLPLELYAPDPEIRFQPLQDTKRALRDVLGYRLYRDLRRGWRIMSPNLEQCGLLQIDYMSLDDLCTYEDIWASYHPALASASPDTRAWIAKTLLDYMRRELAIKVDYLDADYQERVRQRSSQRLIDPWAIDENERMEYASVLFPRSSGGEDRLGNIFVSARGGFGMFLRRRSSFPEYQGERLRLDDTDRIIRELLDALREAGIVQVIVEPRDETDVPGYQLVAASMIWRAGEGTRAFHDPIRVPHESENGGRPNPFFVDFYTTVANMLQGLEAREHTAQVPYEQREEREERFRQGKLPILYCSPTMELGVDIAELNVVNMRNVPPTPANYAQRSGRAGRGGQPALVFTYCSVGSPHDQYFFRRPGLMVNGAVAPPRLDIANEDLVRAHIYAIWLAETQLDLGKTLIDILDVNGDSPSLELLEHARVAVESDNARQRAARRALHVLEMIGEELARTNWYDEEWLAQVLHTVVQRFDHTCDRWRGLYRAALVQAETQGRIRRDPSRSPADRRQADRLRREAESQIQLLTEAENIAQSDFYSYRYFASEGFLPGYSFPRLPISAYIPARRVRQRDEFLSRPRFLAISEFGPRSIIYHEGSRYIINQVILPVGEEGPLTSQVKRCANCGYLHPISQGEGPDLCERCRLPLDPPMTRLLRMQNVVAKRRDRINSDEEERFRLGYDIRSGVRFVEKDGRPTHQVAEVLIDGNLVARLTYAQAAVLWRINLGWTRRKNKRQYGFVLDVERGYWARNEQANEDDPDDPMSPRTERVIPYVEDRRNCLLFEPVVPYEHDEMASLQAAFKRAVEAAFQLENNELAAEPLPDTGERRMLLFYEAAEGGAGVLRRIMDEPGAFGAIARKALEVCHFDPATGQDLRHAPRATEDCEAACYDCLLSYGNQREHALLDRQKIQDILLGFTRAQVHVSPTAIPRDAHLVVLSRLAGSDLEREWLEWMDQHGYRLPDAAQVLIEGCGTRPDFVYEHDYAVIYVDGPHHDYPERQERDRHQEMCLEDEGYTVIRFGYHDDWATTITRYPHIFGGEA
ncbi:DEAD/DEAH box helicase [Patescibacteria group bacterium]|nr:DEAD/DEAH box helicase [Patescibacteria group bacterium]